MSEPRRSTRTRIREDAAPETPKETPSKTAVKSGAKRKRSSVVAKDSVPGIPTTEAVQQVPKYLLPRRLVEGQPLPTLPQPQSLDLPAQEYQDIEQSGVLNASLHRSRTIWTLGSNFRLFHALFTPPKKVADRSEEDKQNIQRQKEIARNFPQVGGAEAFFVIEPHTFKIRLYGPREIARTAQKKAPTYGQWPNHNQYNSYQQHNNAPAAPYPKPPIPQQRPALPKPAQQKPQLPAPRVTTTPVPRVNTTPAPDPVIHMLAQRAGTDPELKAVMKIVAAGQASKEQLEFFQGHISELTNILQKQKEAAVKAPLPPLPPPPPPPLVVAPTPPPRPPVVQQQQQQQQAQQPQNISKPFPPASNAGYQPQVAPATPTQTPYQNPYTPAFSQSQHSNPYGPASQSQKPVYRPLVFDFLEGNGDKFYFPSYSFMEWLPNNQGVKFSFLITKMKPKAKPKVIVTESVPSTPAPKATPTHALGPTPGLTPNAVVTANSITFNTSTSGLAQTGAPVAASTPFVPPPRIEDFDEKHDIKEIEFYQPVTVIILTNNYEVLQALPRAVRPPDLVEKYMNEVFDTCKRAEDTYLAFRLPKEGVAEGETEERRIRESNDTTPAVSAPVSDIIMGGMGTLEKKRTAGRPRKSLVAI